MFFSISKQRQDNFSFHWESGGICVDTDSGWESKNHNNKVYIFKGYADQFDLKLNVLKLESLQPTPGNFCVIVLDKVTDSIKIITDLYRSFPLYYEPLQQVTNLYQLGKTVWTDSVLVLDFDLNVTERNVDVIGNIVSGEISYESALHQVNAILQKKTQQFLSINRLPIKVFLSGGVDTCLVYSYLVQANAKVELLQCNHFDHDFFWRNNHHHVKKYWGYSQLHHYREPCVLASGTPGDEFMLRSPVTANLYLKRHGTSIPALISQNKNCLHYEHFKKAPPPPAIVTPEEMSDWGLCNNLVNDWQHWHLGNTLTWTPLRDLEISKILLRLPQQHAIEQILNSKFSKHLIEKNAPGFTSYISDQKNHGAFLKNLNKFFS